MISLIIYYWHYIKNGGYKISFYLFYTVHHVVVELQEFVRVFFRADWFTFHIFNWLKSIHVIRYASFVLLSKLLRGLVRLKSNLYWIHRVNINVRNI